MAAGNESHKKPEDVGSDSPGSWEAAQQSRAGAEGGPGAGQTAGTGDQPAQASGRRGARHEELPEQRKHFEPGQAPSEQGEKEHPSPHVIAQHQQGAKPRSGDHMQGDRSEEIATSGDPEGTHTRHGRQNLSGDRANRQE